MLSNRHEWNVQFDGYQRSKQESSRFQSGHRIDPSRQTATVIGYGVGQLSNDVRILEQRHDIPEQDSSFGPIRVDGGQMLSQLRLQLVQCRTIRRSHGFAGMLTRWGPEKRRRRWLQDG